jgi:peptidoglycan hydrolase CwlO-like protein
LPEQQPNPKPQVPLGRLLVERGLLTEQELIQALLEQNRTGERIGKVLIRLGYVDEPTVAMALASQHGGPLKTEYGFATGFETDPPAEPLTEASLNPDPAAARPLSSELRVSPAPSDAGAEPESDADAESEEHETPADTSSNEPSSTTTPSAEDDPADDDPAEDDPAPSQVVPFTGAHSSHAELDTAHTRIADVEQELAVAHIRIADVQRELAAAHTRIAELDRRLDTAHARSAELEPELDAANSRIAELEPELDAARVRTTDLEGELAAVQRQLDEQRARTAELDAKVADGRHAAETAIAALQEVAEAS